MCWQHPLYSQWTLFFDSPQSKLLPKTPSSTTATPQIAHGTSLPASPRYSTVRDTC